MAKYTGKHTKEAQNPKQGRHAAPKRGHPLRRIFLSLVLLAALCYSTFVFCPLPAIRYWRDIYIETAMTTATHQWLATYFIPHSIIREVMSKQTGAVDTIGGLKTADGKAEAQPAALPTPEAAAASETEAVEATPTPVPTATPSPTPVPDILGQEALTVGGKNEQGDLVLVNDKEQGIVILEITGGTYVAHLAMIDDPSRVSIATTDRKEVYGTLVCDYLEREDAVLAINANGFGDEGGHGKGGDIAGRTCSSGETWGEYKENYTSYGFTTDDRLLVGKFENWQDYGIRDAAQFNPPLIIDSEIVTAGSNGWGLQPRSCIGQREDGVVLMLIVDGRQPTYSIGATVGDCAEILQRYGAVNACCNDGGSSAVLAYDGKLIGIPSTSMKATGRYLPNAWVVAKK